MFSPTYIKEQQLYIDCLSMGDQVAAILRNGPEKKSLTRKPRIMFHCPESSK